MRWKDMNELFLCMSFSMYKVLCDACEDCSRSVHYKSICYDMDAKFANISEKI